jgi:ATP-dependent DNA ligase
MFELCKFGNEKDIENLEKSGNFLFELKIDGERNMLIYKKGREMKLINRKGFNKIFTYPEVRNIEFNKEVNSITLDGEIATIDNKQSSLLKRQTTDRLKVEILQRINPIVYWVFDILELNGVDLRNCPLIERKKIFAETIKENKFVKILPHTENGLKLWEFVNQNGFEGIVAKRKDSPYIVGRNGDWIKIKRRIEVICKVLGWNEKSGRSSYGSLKTDKGDVGLLSMKHKQEYDEFVKKYGLGNFYVKATCLEFTPSGKMRFPIFVDWVIPKGEENEE